MRLCPSSLVLVAIGGGGAGAGREAERLRAGLESGYVGCRPLDFDTTMIERKNVMLFLLATYCMTNARISESDAGRLLLGREARAAVGGARDDEEDDGWAAAAARLRMSELLCAPVYLNGRAEALAWGMRVRLNE